MDIKMKLSAGIILFAGSVSVMSLASSVIMLAAGVFGFAASMLFFGSAVVEASF